MVKRKIITDEKIIAKGDCEIDLEKQVMIFSDDKGTDVVSFSEMKELFDGYVVSLNISKKSEGDIQ